MSSNRIKYNIRNILQNSFINRDKFVKNKKIYNVMVSKNKTNNHNLIGKRNFGTTTFHIPKFNDNSNDNNNNNNNNNNDILYVAGMLTICYFISKK
jgi:hypothetical protein